MTVATREFGGTSLMGFQKPDHNQPTNRHWTIPVNPQKKRQYTSLIYYIIDILHHWYTTNISCLFCRVLLLIWTTSCKKHGFLNWCKLPLTQPTDQGNQKFGNFNFSLRKKIVIPKSLVPKLPAWLSEWSRFMTQNKWWLTPWKINMEHNHGGWEDDFPF